MPPKAASKTPAPPKTKPTQKGRSSKKEFEKEPEAPKPEGGDDLSDQMEIDWKEEDLRKKLVAEILEDVRIKQGLFPPPGPNASSKKGGGTPKTEFYWMLCQKLFAEHPKYQKAFKMAADSKKAKPRTPWCNKIKNRLRTMTTVTHGYIEEMGTTGAGIVQESDIDMSVKNKFTNRWPEIRDACPWFFDFRDLIGQRPNSIPTGIGNSMTAVDMSVLAPTPIDIEKELDELDDDDERMANEQRGLAGLLDRVSSNSEPGPDETTMGGRGEEVEDLPAFSDDEEGAVKEDDAKSRKRTREDVDSDDPISHGKTPARPSTSKPATQQKSRKKNKMEEFSEIAKTEEVTRQKELDLFQLKTQASIARAQTKAEIVKAKLENQKAKREQKARASEQKARADERRANIEELRLRQKHELHMASLASTRVQAPHHSQSMSFASDHPSDSQMRRDEGYMEAGPSSIEDHSIHRFGMM